MALAGFLHSNPPPSVFDLVTGTIVRHSTTRKLPRIAHHSAFWNFWNTCTYIHGESDVLPQLLAKKVRIRNTLTISLVWLNIEQFFQIFLSKQFLLFKLSALGNKRGSYTRPVLSKYRKTYTTPPFLVGADTCIFFKIQLKRTFHPN